MQLISILVDVKKHHLHLFKVDARDKIEVSSLFTWQRRLTDSVLRTFNLTVYCDFVIKRGERNVLNDLHL